MTGFDEILVVDDPRFDEILVVDDPRFDDHRAPGEHPECPERLSAAREGLAKGIPAEKQRRLEAPDAVPEQLARVHAPEYVAALEEAIASGSGYLDPDTFFSSGSRAATWAAAGGAAAMARALMEEERGCGVALLRPPGHHAPRGRPMGFCMLNHVAVAAAEALACGAEKVAIVDWDVHHGNGTQAIFEADPRVLFVSVHQYPFYPGTGAPEEIGVGEAAGSTVNAALPAGAGPEDYAHAFRELVLPAVEGFGAELLLVSAGFDAHARDPLASMELDAASFAGFAGALRDRTERLGVVLEGGYDLGALADSMAAVGAVLVGGEASSSEDAPRSAVVEAVDRTKRALGWT